MRTQSVILLLGANVGNTEKTIASAIALIERRCGVLCGVSKYYRTAAWGPVKQDDFLNVAIRIRTAMPPGMLMRTLLKIETEFGRKRSEKYGPRTLDIDILFYGRSIIRTRLLHVPHPEIQNRRFALLPSLDLLKGFRHPVLHRTLEELLESCTDTLEVRTWKN